VFAALKHAMEALFVLANDRNVAPGLDPKLLEVGEISDPNARNTPNRPHNSDLG
jgi:hypothetical protein